MNDVNKKPTDEGRHESSADFSLSPTDGLSPQEREFMTRVYPPVSEPESRDPEDHQFSLRQLFWATFIAALGFAGGSWASANDYAGMLGFTWLFLYLVRPIYRPEVAYFDIAFFSVGVAYGCATFRALIEGFRQG